MQLLNNFRVIREGKVILDSIPASALRQGSAANWTYNPQVDVFEQAVITDINTVDFIPVQYDNAASFES